MDSDSVKKAIIKQVILEANIQNSRQLVEVRTTPYLQTTKETMLNYQPENQRKLLRQVHPQAR